MANARPQGRARVDDRLLNYLTTRRTVPAAQMGEPGPDPETLRSILEIAARVPDHGKLAPWRFIIYDRGSRDLLIDGLGRIAVKGPDEKEGRIRADKARALGQAPVVVGVVSAPIGEHPKIPLWEQQLSAGAVCLNLLHAAQAHGYAAQWLTGWFAYQEEAMRWLGLKDGERFAGFLHIGTPTMPPSERDRPNIDAITTKWQAPGRA
jgi:nitroreductase